MISASAHVIQKTGSKQFIDRKLSTPRYSPATSTPTIASAAARRPPPSAHAITPVRNTFAPPANAGNSRSDHMWSCPKSVSVTRATTATMGG